MTTPVLMTGENKMSTMSFVLPTLMNKHKIPIPLDDKVVINQLKSGRFAVY